MKIRNSISLKILNIFDLKFFLFILHSGKIFLCEKKYIFYTNIYLKEINTKKKYIN